MIQTVAKMNVDINDNETEPESIVIKVNENSITSREV